MHANVEALLNHLRNDTRRKGHTDIAHEFLPLPQSYTSIKKKPKGRRSSVISRLTYRNENAVPSNSHPTTHILPLQTLPRIHEMADAHGSWQNLPSKLVLKPNPRLNLTQDGEMATEMTAFAGRQRIVVPGSRRHGLWPSEWRSVRRIRAADGNSGASRLRGCDGDYDSGEVVELLSSPG